MICIFNTDRRSSVYSIYRILLLAYYCRLSYATYYRVLPTIEEEIVNQTQESYCWWGSLMGSDTLIASDGS